MYHAVQKSFLQKPCFSSKNWKVEFFGHLSVKVLLNFYDVPVCYISIKIDEKNKKKCFYLDSLD